MTSSRHGTGKYERLLAKCKRLEPVPTAVAHPCEKTALRGAVEAGGKGLIEPILVGPRSRPLPRPQESTLVTSESWILHTARHLPRKPWSWFGKARRNC
jgi:hypothetical protein